MLKQIKQEMIYDHSSQTRLKSTDCFSFFKYRILMKKRELQNNEESGVISNALFGNNFSSIHEVFQYT